MSTTVQQTRGGGAAVQRPQPSGLADVLELILDKGLVIDVFVRVSLVGIEVLTIDARIVIASVDTYLRFAEAVDRLDLEAKGGRDLPELMQEMSEGGANSMSKGATRGVVDAAKEKVQELTDDDDDEGSSEGGDESASEERPSRTRRQTQRKTTSRSSSQRQSRDR